MSKDKDEPADGNAWVIDSLIQFLSGPVWNRPIAAFIEKHCAIFDPDGEQSAPEHRQVHLEYRNLVDSLLGGFVEELQITPSQFQDAVSNQNSNNVARFQPGALLEQIWAASDFSAFSHLMGLHNLELQLQALNAIRHQSGAPLPMDYSEDGKLLMANGEERLLKHVLRRSMEEAQIMERMNKKFNRLSLAEEPSKPVIAVPKQGAAKNKATKATENDNKVVELPRKLTEEEIQKRKDYLCKQRDKLMQAKGKSKTSASLDKVPDKEDEAAGGSALYTEKEESEDALQMRRALVNRLKAEIINKK
ncbi:cilia- and flagella-associated protein 36 [Neocloeon triangulifer]|uniref:cilia- and flagella-associated protein 36 n=1 Tax=Neocloeon triangulifer TaxID=2078957 RepID=UPI00286EBA0B|nr:cilia- and flagella-associated protein 36 [Neocloeon triangulifer]